MSVKSMTTEQLQDDLESIARTWPNGIPTEQNDRVTALKGELKRRGAEMRTIRPVTGETASDRPRNIIDMSDVQLEKELRKLSQTIGSDPKDEDAQNRFADVRFEMRKRAKAAPSSPPVAPREIEIPDTVETKKPSLPEGEQVRRAEPIANGRTSIKGFSADAQGNGVLVKYTAQVQDGSIIQVAAMLSPEDAAELALLVGHAARKAVGQ